MANNEREEADREPSAGREGDGRRQENAGKRADDSSGAKDKMRHHRQPGPRPGSGGTVHPAAFTLVIGVFAGIFLGLIRWFAWGLEFTRILPAFLADPFVRRGALSHVGWHWIGWLIFIAMSVVGAFVYWLAMGRLRGPWPGLVFGVAWWALLVFVVGPPTGMFDPYRKLGWTTLITELCVYSVWGLFIGFSYAFEFHDEAGREPITKELQAGGDPQPAS